jgi:hypothetical protein
LADYGLEDRSRRGLDTATPDVSATNYLTTMAQVGDEVRSETILNQVLEKYPDETVVQAVLAPEVRATLDLRRGRPRDALADLTPAAAIEQTAASIRYPHGAAFLAAGDTTGAVKQFESIVGLDPVRTCHPVNQVFPLARLGLAQAGRSFAESPVLRGGRRLLEGRGSRRPSGAAGQGGVRGARQPAAAAR